MGSCLSSTAAPRAGTITTSSGVQNPTYDSKLLRKVSSKGSINSLTSAGKKLTTTIGTSLRNSLRFPRNTSMDEQTAKVLIIGTEGSGKTALFKALLSVDETEEKRDRKDFPSNRVLEERVKFKNQLFKLVDLGNTDRLGWLDYFEGVSALVFVASLSHYDEIDDHSEKNKFEESLELFETMINNSFLEEATIIILLNDSGKFKEKLIDRRIPINKTGIFQDAPQDFDYEKTIDWLRNKFYDLAGKRKARNVTIQVVDTNSPENYSQELELCIQKIAKRRAAQINALL